MDTILNVVLCSIVIFIRIWLILVHIEIKYGGDAKAPWLISEPFDVRMDTTALQQATNPAAKSNICLFQCNGRRPTNIGFKPCRCYMAHGTIHDEKSCGIVNRLMRYKIRLILPKILAILKAHCNISHIPLSDFVCAS